ncbi:hypothetical protein [Streptomyces sp. NPDC046182]|uniref:hypothetical protein n=1 Tax=Streptomyces sp. NPDC046182 TaxID=3154601 RepID=UPI003401A740
MNMYAVVPAPDGNGAHGPPRRVRALRHGPLPDPADGYVGWAGESADGLADYLAAVGACSADYPASGSGSGSG